MAVKQAKRDTGRSVIGEYNRTGYEVWLYQNGEPTRQLCVCGNSHWDSTLEVSPGSLGALSLREIRSGCIQTAREIADEEGAAYGGVDRREDDEVDEEIKEAP